MLAKYMHSQKCVIKTDPTEFFKLPEKEACVLLRITGLNLLEI